jgi:hypothetical protein
VLVSKGETGPSRTNSPGKYNNPEQQLGSGALSAVLDERQLEQVRDLVESLGAIRAHVP